MVGFWGGKGSEVLWGDLEGRKELGGGSGRRQCALRGCTDGRAGSDLRVQINGHLGRKAPFHSKNHLPGMFAAGNHAE